MIGSRVVTCSSAGHRRGERHVGASALANGPVLGNLRDASDDLFAWAATRVAMYPQATLESYGLP